ncbi:MAG TPA: hypothetical protein VN922_21065 [Bacteroidia bacterium]|nr:hypothetical protein [Bacteroidia bacterium]
MKLLLTFAATSLLVFNAPRTMQAPPAMAPEKIGTSLLQTKDGNKEGKASMIEYQAEDGSFHIAVIENVPEGSKEMDLKWKTRGNKDKEFGAPTAWLDYKGRDGKLHATKIHMKPNAANKEDGGYEFDIITRGINGDKEEKHHSRLVFLGYTGEAWQLEKLKVFPKGEVNFMLKKAEEEKK